MSNIRNVNTACDRFQSSARNLIGRVNNVDSREEQMTIGVKMTLQHLVRQTEFDLARLKMEVDGLRIGE